ncbi:hypothetical protein ACN38_g3349 [Penicillium nordicum]|uniref:Protein kinase domain-containing protein n=1 Tax=Penicillium nordicum TaxID=229535 RepID=A0A0M8P5U4_9EURO|nr:hypothetical protein ACN38_g3349 [Penicillium nordicum]
MDSFESNPLWGWRLETGYDADGDRHHQRPSGSERWRAVRCLGKGSFGDVWQEHCISGPSKDAIRAVKRLSKRQSTFSEMSRRELNALVTFSNSHIPEYRNYFVQCLGWFDDIEHFYIAMEFFEYGDLQKYIIKPFSEPEAASITVQVAQALQYMHQKNFVHRDIKPLNILVSSLGPRWHVKVADFGIAKNVDGTALGTLQIGSLGYMAPELWGNSPDPYTAAVDVWALGAVAFCLRTGFPPFRTIQHLLDYARDHKTHFPLRPLGTSSGFCMNFVLGTMAEAPERRFTIEQILAHDWLSMQLGVSQGGEPGGNAIDGLTALNVPPSNAWSDTYSSSSTHQPQPRSPSMPDIDPVRTPLPSRNSPLRSGAQNLRENLDKGMKKLTVAATYLGQQGYDREEKIGKELVSQVGLGREVVGYHNGGRLASGSSDKTVKIWDPATGRCVSTLKGHSDGVQSVAWSHNGGRLASGSSDKTVKIWDPATGHCISTLKGHSNWVQSVAWSHNSGRLASGSEDNTVKIWDPATGHCISTLKGHSDWVRSVAWSHDGSRLAAGSSDKTVKIWDPATGHCILTLKGHHGFIRSVSWSRNGDRLASASVDKTVKIWDPATGHCILTLKGHNSWVQSVAWSHDGGRLASGSSDNTVKIWDPATGHCISTLKVHSHSVRSVAWSHNGDRLASGSLAETVKIWDPATWRCVSTLKGHDDYVFSVAWWHDGGGPA